MASMASSWDDVVRRASEASGQPRGATLFLLGLALAPAIAQLATTGGKLALSGVLAPQASEVCDAFARAGFADVRVTDERDGWVLIEGTRE